MKLLKIFAVALGILAGIATIPIGFMVWSSVERITIRNQSGSKVESLKIDNFRLGSLKPGKSRTKWIWIGPGKQTLHFEADFGVGITTGVAVGYVTQFMAGKSEIILLPGGHYDVREN